MIPSLSDFQLVLVLSLHQLPPTLGPLGGWSVSQEFASLSLEGRALPHSLLDLRVALAQGVLPTLGDPLPLPEAQVSHVLRGPHVHDADERKMCMFDSIINRNGHSKGLRCGLFKKRNPSNCLILSVHL